MNVPYENAPESWQASEATNQNNSNVIIGSNEHQVNIGYYPNPQTVIGRVLGALLRRERITAKDIWIRLASNRLSHHIYQLRIDGWPIQIDDTHVITKDAKRPATIGTYWLPSSVIEQAGEYGQKYAAETLRIERERRAA